MYLLASVQYIKLQLRQDKLLIFDVVLPFMSCTFICLLLRFRLCTINLLITYI